VQVDKPIRIDSSVVRHDNHNMRVRFQSFRRFCDPRQDIIIPVNTGTNKIQLKRGVLHDNIIIN